jgi:hypothetical protein
MSKVRRLATRPIDSARPAGRSAAVGGGNSGPKMKLLACKGVSTAGVRTVPDAVSDYINLFSDAELPPHLEEQADEAMAGAMAELRRRRLLVLGQPDAVARGEVVLNGH